MEATDKKILVKQFLFMKHERELKKQAKIEKIAKEQKNQEKRAKEKVGQKKRRQNKELRRKIKVGKNAFFVPKNKHILKKRTRVKPFLVIKA